MPKLKFFVCYILISISICANNGLNIDSIFNASNSAYENNIYDAAKGGYLQILNSGYFSKELYLNLGNSYFKMDSLAHAILFYEKGLKVSPGNESLIHNLKICNKLIKDKSSVNESVHISDWIVVFLGKSTNYWANSSIWLMFMSFILLSLFLFSKSALLKKATFYTSIVAFCFSIVTFYFSWFSNTKLKDSNYCILFTPYTWVKAEPSENAESNFKLHEGSKMKIIDENEKWLEISFDDKIGWIEKKEVQRI